MAGMMLCFVAGAAIGGIVCWAWMEQEAAQKWEDEHPEIEVWIPKEKERQNK